MSDELRRVGAMWKPKPGSKVLGTGVVAINGFKQRFFVMRNDRKTPGSREPDYRLLSSDAPEPDDYAERPAAVASQAAEAEDDSIPF